MKKYQFVALACISLFSITTAIAAHAQSFTSLGLFNGGNGRFPDSFLIQGIDGNFYGETSMGGPGGGSVFRMTPGGAIAPVYDFCLKSGCPDGEGPYGGLVQDADGNLYGTTYNGGSGRFCPANIGGCGTVFRITAKGLLTTLYNFCSQAKCADGAFPNGLMQGLDENFFGTSVGYNGSPTCIGQSRTGCGTVFEITPAGQLTTLHEFCSQSSCADGYGPSSGLTLGTDGNLYGTTMYGGANLYGVMFKINLQGSMTTLYNFCSLANCADGAQPRQPLVQAPDGNFYGTAWDCGSYRCGGTVFSVNPNGHLTTLHTLCTTSGCPDGNLPSGLVLASDGNFYGTTESGGANNYGTIFGITPAGQFSTEYSFSCTSTNCSDGAIPVAGLLQSTNGTFYGTTNTGGDYLPEQGAGVAFSWDLGLAPFVAAQFNFGKVGQVATILGNNLTGTTSVTFNGIAAAFKIGSATYLKTQVPSGVTTGTIQVTTPNGTLNSIVAFQILP